MTAFARKKQFTNKFVAHPFFKKLLGGKKQLQGGELNLVIDVMSAIIF
jgi:hypothetical protein